jgi:hypothetical protein
LGMSGNIGEIGFLLRAIFLAINFH